MSSASAAPAGPLALRYALATSPPTLAAARLSLQAPRCRPALRAAGQRVSRLAGVVVLAWPLVYLVFTSPLAAPSRGPERLQGKLHIEYQQTLLAQYRYDYHRQRKRIANVSQPTLYQTEFQSPQVEMLELDDKQWLKARQRPYRRHWKPDLPEVEQPPLFEPVDLLLCYLLLLIWRFPPSV